MLKQALTVTTLLIFTSFPLMADEQMDALKKQVETLQSQLDQTTSAIEQMMQKETTGNDKTHFGGYGELHYNNLDSGNEMDFHRFVVFMAHDFSDSVRFFSEVELEHSLAGDGKPGEVELEQAAIQFDINQNHSVTGGLFLLPVGILNETHEPPTFYGVERNPVESNIIPTTWWEGGAMFSGELNTAWHYDLAVTSGLSVVTNVADSNAYKIRNGRQKVAEAMAESLAYTARITWKGIPGTELGVTFQRQDDVTQDTAEKASANLVETHASYQQGPFAARALYASWSIDGTDAETVGRDEQKGWYLEPSYRFSEKWGIFARYNRWDNEAGDSADSVNKQSDAGVNYWPHPDVVIKADIRNQSGASDDDGFNLGIGYQF